MIRFNLFKAKFKNPEFNKYYLLNLIKNIFIFFKDLLWKTKFKRKIKKISSIEELSKITALTRPGTLNFDNKREDSEESSLR